MILNQITKSLSVELTKFIQRLCSHLPVVSKQAFSKARYKLRPEAFIELNELVVRSYYEQGVYKLYRDKYLVLCADGSDYELPWQPDLIEAFGKADNGQGQAKCMAKGIKIWDGINHINVSCVLDRYDSGELNLFKQIWEEARYRVERRSAGDLLLVADQLYPSFWLMLNAQRQGWDFVLRCKPSFCREVRKFMQGDALTANIKIALANKSGRKSRLKRQGVTNLPEYLKVRVVRIHKANGEQGCLITSIPAKTLDYSALRELYWLRWGVETAIGFDKSRSQIENFSAKKVQGIRQDW